MTTPDIPTLLAATCDLESGHPIEAVLRAHGVPERHSAYDVVRHYKRLQDRAYYAGSIPVMGLWNSQAKILRPCVLAIAEYLWQQKQAKED